MKTFKNNNSRRHHGKGSKIYAPDRIGIVGFHDRSFVVAKPADPFAPWLQDRTQTLHEKVSGSGTNIADGIRLATTLLSRTPKGVRRRMWLLSDGEPNVEVAAISSEVRRARECWVNINTIGFGDQFNESLLRAISTATHNGRFVAVNSLRALTKALVGGSERNGMRSKWHHRSETTILVVDCSPSMTLQMEGKRRIQVVEEAVLHLLHYKQRLFS